MNAEEIAQLALRVQAGEREALEALLQACHPLVYRLALSILDDAGDLRPRLAGHTPLFAHQVRHQPP